jgi:hypothetical protein
MITCVHSSTLSSEYSVVSVNTLASACTQAVVQPAFRCRAQASQLTACTCVFTSSVGKSTCDGCMSCALPLHLASRWPHLCVCKLDRHDVAVGCLLATTLPPSNTRKCVRNVCGSLLCIVGMLVAARLITARRCGGTVHRAGVRMCPMLGVRQHRNKTGIPAEVAFVSMPCWACTAPTVVFSTVEASVLAPRFLPQDAELVVSGF